MKNSEPVFNINITLQDKNTSTPYNTSIKPNNPNNRYSSIAFNPSDPTVSLNIPGFSGSGTSITSRSSNILYSNTSNLYNNTNSSNYAMNRPNNMNAINTRIDSSSNINNINAPVYSTDDLYSTLENSGNVEYSYTDDTQEEQIVPTRIYEPINYKQHYMGPSQYRPNVCSYGTKQIVNPIYLNADGTDLREAIENTQIGSIMPKFVYREYEDVK